MTFKKNKNSSQNKESATPPTAEQIAREKQRQNDILDIFSHSGSTSKNDNSKTKIKPSSKR